MTARSPSLLWSTLFGLLLSGCAVKTTVGLLDADQAVRHAEASGALDLATHDATMARAYLDEAQHQYARSHFQSADEMAAEAIRLANAATQKAAVGGDPSQIVPEEVQPAPAPEEQGQTPEEPDNSELMQIIGEDQDTPPDPDKKPSIMEDDKLDTDIFDEDTE
ncbi:MAG: hypothetical protein GXP62_00775 [Oligoflexia bacterium]|nr:hypothetical protein [Oligoflexia bacterium]